MYEWSMYYVRHFLVCVCVQDLKKTVPQKYLSEKCRSLGGKIGQFGVYVGVVGFIRSIDILY